MKRFLFLVLLGLGIQDLHAFHIVGGELEFITVEPGVYQINLIQYRDEAQHDNTTIIDQYTVYIFSGKDDHLVSTHTLSRVSHELIDYTNPECSIDELKTSRVIWTDTFPLDPEKYADEEGYYVVWERCCRNTAIKNIVNPEQTGMKYVVDIPPLWKDGKPFVNSSPVLLKPLSDYACVDQLYYTSFTGTDIDGDSLVYRLATPLNSSVYDPLPIPQPRPHIPVLFASGYSENNMIPGSPPLRISSRGLLTVAPQSKGLYVFSVIVEEWRDGVKIGQVQRDFQMLTVEGCDIPDPPEVGVQIPGNDSFQPELDTLKYTLADDKCFNFYVTNIAEGDTIRLRAEGVNFVGNIDEIFSFTTSHVGTGVDTLEVQVCVPGCPPVRDRPFIVDLIAGDDACPLPQLDTVRLMIEVEPPPNTFPALTGINSSYTVNENDQLEVVITSMDAELDSIVPMMVVEGVADPGALGMELEVTRSEAGDLEAVFRWNTDCQMYDFSENNAFKVGLLMEDVDTCEVENPNITWVDMEVNLPSNTSPEAYIETDSISIEFGEVVDILVGANDADMDLVDLSLAASGSSRAQLGLSFTDASGMGNVESRFLWVPDCKRLGASGEADYIFYFVAEDQDRCQVSNRDTVQLKVHLMVPPNTAPEFAPLPDTSIEVNQLLELDVTAFEADDEDSITISFFDAVRLPDSPSLSFESVSGKGTVTSALSWQPECDLLDFGQTSAFFELAFLVYDNRCPVQKLDTMSLMVEVFETREQFERFQPPNVFTPNDDGWNDTYSLSNLRMPRHNLPPDNCDDAFQFIKIFDRNGNEVYEAADRDFVWDGKNVSSGVYYYLIRYSRTEYKGYLQVLR